VRSFVFILVPKSVRPGAVSSEGVSVFLPRTGCQIENARFPLRKWNRCPGPNNWGESRKPPFEALSIEPKEHGTEQLPSALCDAHSVRSLRLDAMSKTPYRKLKITTSPATSDAPAQRGWVAVSARIGRGICYEGTPSGANPKTGTITSGGPTTLNLAHLTRRNTVIPNRHPASYS